MHATFSLGRIAGMRIGANWSLIVVVWLIAWSLADYQLPLAAEGYTSVAYWATGVIASITFFACLLAHELAHSIVARRYDIEVEGIVLWLFGGVSQLKEDAPNAEVELRVAAAGPAMSLVIAAGFLTTTAVVIGVGGPELLAAGLAWLGWINGILAVFNLVPAFPLDGGRVLRAWLWHRHGDKNRATVAAAFSGRIFAYALIALGLLNFAAGGALGGLWLVFLGWFLLSASSAEANRSILDTRLAGVAVRSIMSPEPIVAPAGVTVEQLIEGWLYRHRCSTFPLVGPDGAVVGLVTISRIKRVEADRRPTTPALDIAATGDEILRFDAADSLVDVIAATNSSPDQRALIFDQGALVGIVSPSDVARALERAALAER